MSVERLAHPEWWTPALLVWGAALAAVVLARLVARRRRRRLGPAAPAGLALAGDGVLLLALACLAAALLGPRFGEKRVSLPASGVDLVLLLDVSRSMDAADTPPSRLERARRAAEELLARLEPPDRAALAAFAGRGVLLTPLTPDRDALAQLLAAFDTGLVDPPSSDLGAGVRAALAAFERGSERPRVLFVLSDGEDPEQRGEIGVAEALRAEVRVLAGALGSELGSTLLDHGAPLRDPSGAVVISRRRADRLERLAAATGGELYRADAWGAFDFEAAAEAIRRDAGRLPGERVERRVRAVQVLPFAGLAFALLAAPPLAQARGRRGLLATALLAAGALLVGAGAASRGHSLTELEARVRARPGDARLLVELGLARLARGHHAGAQRALLAAAVAAREPWLAALAYYDLGVAALERGDLEDARDAFFDALALDPSDRQARFNLEWTLEALRKSAQRPPEEPDAEAAGEPRRPRPEPPVTGPGEEPETTAQPAARGLSEEQRRSWLDRVQDDPAYALRTAAGDQRRAGRPVRAW